MLIIAKAKPNPAGKDRQGSFTSKAQLAGEWIDIINNGYTAVGIGGLEVYNLAYTTTGTHWSKVTTLGSLALPGQAVLRLHSGGFLETSQMFPVDVAGANYHFFTGKNYVWNNSQPDKPWLYNPFNKTTVDVTWYAAPVQEGKILTRIGDKLV